MFVFESHLAFKMEHAEYRPAWVLYVGRAGGNGSRATLRQRFKNEYSSYLRGSAEQLWSKSRATSRRERLSRYLSMYPIQYWFAVIGSPEAIPLLEDRLLKLLCPPLNDRDLPRLKRGPSVPAFTRPE
jgi:hypothetical protein